jgi:ATP-dependent protease Clp ATPase subunit
MKLLARGRDAAIRGALRAVAQEAIARKSDARELRSILESMMLGMLRHPLNGHLGVVSTSGAYGPSP